MTTTTTTTIITQDQALCMFHGVEYTTKDVKDCKKKTPWAIMGYASNIGDQIPMALYEDHFRRHSVFVKYAENKKEETLVKEQKTAVKRKAGKYIWF